MDAKLTLNDGAELEGYFTETEVRLFVYIWNKTLAEVFELMIDPEKTKKMVCERYDLKETVRGYKKLMTVNDEGSNMISVALKKG